MGTNIHTQCPSCHTVQALAQNLNDQPNRKQIVKAVKYKGNLEIFNQCHTCKKPFRITIYLEPMVRIITPMP